MIAAFLEEGRVDVRELPRPERPSGWSRIRLVTAGICNTDLELQRGYYGFSGVPGHEFVGKVSESDRPDLVGQRVVGEINIACGACEWCRAGLGRHCSSRTVLGIIRHPGAFAEELVLPDGNLHTLPDAVATDHAVFAEPIAAACEILEQVSFPAAAEVAVLGDGKLGLLIAQVLASRDLRVHHFGRHPDKLSISAQCGVNVSTDAPPRAAFQWVVEATGSAEGLHSAIAAARPRGTVILKSTVHTEVPLDTAAVVVNEITLIGSRCGRFEPALDLLRGGALQLEPLISARYRLGDAEAAFAHAARKGTLKVLLDNS